MADRATHSHSHAHSLSHTHTHSLTLTRTLTPTHSLSLWQIAQLEVLATLDLRDNLLSDLPIDIGLCTALHSLHLDRNRFDNIPENLCNLAHVQVRESV